MTEAIVHIFPCLKDNYGFLLHDPATGETATIDTPEAGKILAEAEAKGWKVTQVWNTHWHPDHAGGNAEIVAKTGAKVVGPKEVDRIGLAPDRILREGDTVVYCAHEYTASNAAFALSVDAGNAALLAYADEVKAKRAKDIPTVPTTIGKEKAANPFLRADDTKLQAFVGHPGDVIATFAEVRERKNNF